MYTSKLTHPHTLIIQDLTKCSRMWSFDVTPGLSLSPTHVERVQYTESLDACKQLCSAEQLFICRSAIFEAGSKNCFLSRFSLRSSFDAFISSTSESVYIESLCNNVPRMDCDFTTSRSRSTAKAYVLRDSPAEDFSICQQECVDLQDFSCRSFHYDPESQRCQLSPDDSVSLKRFNDTAVADGGSEGVRMQEIDRCMEAHVACTETEMKASFSMDQEFNGKLYSMTKPETCSFSFRQTLGFNVSLSLTDRNKCGILNEEAETVTATLMMQYHPLLMTGKDRIFRLICSFQQGSQVVEDSVVLEDRSTTELPRVVSGNSPLPQAYMKIVNRQGQVVSTAEVGQELYAEVILKENPARTSRDIPQYGLFVTDCLAFENDNKIELIDHSGCPTDITIFEGFHPVPGSDSKIFRAAFQGFSFEHRKRININCNVNFCFKYCEPAHCTDSRGRKTQSFGRRKRKREIDNPRQLVGLKRNVETSLVIGEPRIEYLITGVMNFTEEGSLQVVESVRGASRLTANFGEEYYNLLAILVAPALGVASFVVFMLTLWICVTKRRYPRDSLTSNNSSSLFANA